MHFKKKNKKKKQQIPKTIIKHLDETNSKKRICVYFLNLEMYDQYF